jgi:hypothetical protein
MPDTVEELQKSLALARTLANMATSEVETAWKERNEAQRKLYSLQRGVFVLESPEAFCADVASLYGFKGAN